MTREERLVLLKQIEKDIHVCSLESTFFDDAKSCAIHSVIEELEKKGVTNQEYIATLTPNEFWNTIQWLQKDYGKRYTDSYQAIIEWLSAKRSGEE